MQAQDFSDNKKSDKEQEQKRNIERLQTPLQRFQATAPKQTLDEGVGSTLVNQFKGMCIKFSYVLIPRSPDRSDRWIKDWDLWGPFILCLIFALFVDNEDVFLMLVFSVFIGATIVAFNTRILGGKISFLQSISVLGYCILPLLIGVFILQLLKFLRVQNQLIRFIVMTLAVIWSIFAARSFVTVNISKGKKFVALFPIILFYIFLGLLLTFN